MLSFPVFVRCTDLRLPTSSSGLQRRSLKRTRSSSSSSLTSNPSPLRQPLPPRRVSCQTCSARTLRISTSPLQRRRHLWRPHPKPRLQRLSLALSVWASGIEPRPRLAPRSRLDRRPRRPSSHKGWSDSPARRCSAKGLTHRLSTPDRHRQVFHPISPLLLATSEPTCRSRSPRPDLLRSLSDPAERP